MSIFVQGKAVSSAQELFMQLNESGPQGYTSALKSSRTSVIPFDENGIGTIDATSCIGVVYHTPNNSLYVHHHDGRAFESLLPLFDINAFKDAIPVKATLVGGCRQPNEKGEFVHTYSRLEQRYTKKNFEDIVHFWRAKQLNIDVQGWAIGDDKANATLCSDFVAGPDGKIALLEPGVAVKQNLVPELGRRSAKILANEKEYVLLFDSSKDRASFHLPDVTNDRITHRSYFSPWQNLSDEAALKNSTTPLLEPPHFADMIRKVGRFMAGIEDARAKTIERPKGPVILLQGEAGRLDLT